tara:strand:+ start:200 stop:733 length:534 start_codon:yes stop_codon:yes gene_type:complete
MSNRTVQARLKDLKAQGLSYAQLARELKVSRSLVSRWASGERTPSSKAKRSIYGRWRRIDKRLRNPGARVDLSGYFRKVWFKDGVVFKPFNYRNVPPYNFPNNAAVVITVRFELTLADEGGINKQEASININYAPNGDIAIAIDERFDEYFRKWIEDYQEGTLIKFVRKAVVLRWLK